MPTDPMLRDYRVGIVIPSAGINTAQLATIGKRLDEIAKLLPTDGHIEVYVPGFNLADAEISVVRDLRNLLERKGKVRITYIPTRGDHKAGVAEHIIWELGPRSKRCDEIWCCPALGQTANSSARVAQVWRLGQASPTHQRYKTIPPWVENPAVSNQPKKGKKSWRDLFNKRSFHW